MIVRNIKIDMDHNQNVNYHGVTVYAPGRPDIKATIEAILSINKYEDLMMMFRSQNGFGNNNIRLANLITNTLTADIVQNNKDNEEFLLSLISKKTAVISKEETYSFKEYAKKHLPEFTEKYKLLLV